MFSSLLVRDSCWCEKLPAGGLYIANAAALSVITAAAAK